VHAASASRRFHLHAGAQGPPRAVPPRRRPPLPPLRLPPPQPHLPPLLSAPRRPLRQGPAEPLTAQRTAGVGAASDAPARPLLLHRRLQTSQNSRPSYPPLPLLPLPPTQTRQASGSQQTQTPLAAAAAAAAVWPRLRACGLEAPWAAPRQPWQRRHPRVRRRGGRRARARDRDRDLDRAYLQSARVSRLAPASSQRAAAMVQAAATGATGAMAVAAQVDRASPRRPRVRPMLRPQ
jgi:hypothetical protein